LIDSFDSTAWTRPVNRTLNANYSCKTREERIKFFDTWLERFLEISNDMAKNTSLEAYLYKEVLSL
jgi:hypothetical protein